MQLLGGQACRAGYLGDDVFRRGSCVAVKHRDASLEALCATASSSSSSSGCSHAPTRCSLRREGVSDYHVLAAALRPHKDKRLAVLDPWLHHAQCALGETRMGVRRSVWLARKLQRNEPSMGDARYEEEMVANGRARRLATSRRHSVLRFLDGEPSGEHTTLHTIRLQSSRTYHQKSCTSPGQKLWARLIGVRFRFRPPSGQHPGRRRRGLWGKT